MMKTRFAILILLLSACGGGSSGSSGTPAAATPDLSHWSSYPDAIDSCDGTLCRAQFTAVENCGYAIFKYVVIGSGTMRVQTKTGVFVRQGQPHDIVFEETGETFASSAADVSHHLALCLGQDGTL